MDVHIWAEDLASWNLIAHLLTGLLVLGALTHHLVIIARGRTAARPRATRRLAFWATLGYLLSFAWGVLVYPSFRYYVRHLYLDDALPWATGLFEIKEHALAIGLAVLPAYYASSRSVKDLDAKDRRFHVLSVLVLNGLVWYGFIVGAVVVNMRGV